MLVRLDIQEQTSPRVHAFVQSEADMVLTEGRQVLNTVLRGGEAHNSCICTPIVTTIVFEIKGNVCSRAAAFIRLISWTGKLKARSRDNVVVLS